MKNENNEKKEFLGMPMRWDRKNMFKNYWNKESDKIILPKNFGIGWDFNFYALLKAMGLVKNKSDKNQRSNDSKI